jgi:hypothetical protein
LSGCLADDPVFYYLNRRVLGKALKAKKLPPGMFLSSGNGASALFFRK